MKTKGPNLDMYLEGKNKRYVTYVQGASIYRMNYYTFVRLAKEAGANIRSRRTVVVDLDIFDAYIMSFAEKEEDENGLQTERR